MDPKCIFPGAYYFLTRRCVQRQFLLKPNADTVRMFGYALALAAQYASVGVVGFCVLSNHYHIVIYDPHANVADFTTHLNSQLARSFNAYWERAENFWATDSLCQVELVTRADIVEKLAYTLVNPVEAGLVGKASAWEGATSWAAMAHNEPIVSKRPEVYYRRCRPKKARLDLHLADDNMIGARAAFVADVIGKVAELEKEVGDARSRNKASVFGMAAVRAQKHTDSPRSSNRHELFGLVPRVACRSKWHRIAALQRNATFIRQHREARQALLRGKRAVFPAGTCALWQLMAPADRPNKPAKPDLYQRDANGALWFD